LRPAALAPKLRIILEVARLRQQLNELRSYVAQIAINAHRIGLQPEMLLCVAQQAIDTDGALNANLLVMGYLSGIGLLAKLDANVRGGSAVSSDRSCPLP
jgi:hypothetical protein